MKPYKRLFKESDNKDLFTKALKTYQAYYKDEQEDIQKISKMSTSAEVQRYKRKFNKNTFEMNTSGLFRKVKSMEELPKSFKNKMIKQYNNRDSKSVLSGKGNSEEIQIMIDIIQQIIGKIK